MLQGVPAFDVSALTVGARRSRGTGYRRRPKNPLVPFIILARDLLLFFRRPDAIRVADRHLALLTQWVTILQRVVQDVDVEVVSA
jgi:hypothetical protein